MVRAVEGVYQDGKIKLSQAPADIKSSRVYVLFIDDRDPSQALSDQDRERAIEELIDEMDKGHHLGGGPLPKREELYERGGSR